MTNNLTISTSGQGLPLVLIHGWGLNSAIWQPCAELLKENFQIISVCLPGFGSNTDIDLNPYRIDEVADLIAKAVNQPAVYLGWSLGGLVATKIALNHPSVVKGLITVASSPYFVEQEHWAGIDANVLTMFHRQLSRDPKKTIDNFLKIQAMGSPHIRDDIKVIRQLVMQYPLPSMSILDHSLSLLENVDLRDDLANVSQPFLRLYGKLDGLVPKRVIPLVAELAPNSEHHIFLQSSHAPFISEQANFVAFVSDWLIKHFEHVN